MSVQQCILGQKQEPLWFSKVRETFGDLIYDTKIKVLGIDIYKKISVNYDSYENALKIILDYSERNFIRWRD